MYRLTVKIMKYLVNLSNHPSAGWSDEQKNAASEYGMVVDLPFPDVDPELDSVDELAKQFVREHFSDQDRNTTVHVMGEMTFVYNVVRRLCVLGITCIASTTKRVVEEVDGKKVSQFKFVKFRKYE